MAQISGQNAIGIAFSRLIGSPLSTTNRLKKPDPANPCKEQLCLVLNYMH